MTEPSSRPTTTRLAGNALVQAVGTVVSSLISVVTFAAITRYLGPEGYGPYAAATSFVFIPTVLADLGLSAAVLRDISASPESTERAVGAALPLRIAVSAVAVVVTVVAGLVLPFDSPTRSAVLIASIGAFLTLLTLSLLPVLQARLEMHWVVSATVVGRVVSLAATLAVLEAGLGLKSVVAAGVLGVGVTLVITLAVVLRKIHLRPRVDTSYWRQLIAVSLVLGVAVALGQIYFRVDTVIVSLLRSDTEVGLYGAAYKFVEIAEVLSAAVVLSIFPTLSRFAAAADPRLHGAVQRTFDVVLATAVPITVLLATIPETILRLVAGDDFVDAATALRILSFYPLLAFGNTLLWRLLVAGRREKALLRISAAILALNIALNFALIPTFGYLVAAVTSLLSEACSLALVIYLVKTQMSYRPGVRYTGVLLAGAALMTGATLLLPLPALVAAIVGGGLYLVTVLVLPGTVRTVARELATSTRGALGR